MNGMPQAAALSWLLFGSDFALGLTAAPKGSAVDIQSIS
jgi:hypothetical protein